jgi:hypothetical protein
LWPLRSDLVLLGSIPMTLKVVDVFVRFRTASLIIKLNLLFFSGMDIDVNRIGRHRQV